MNIYKEIIYLFIFVSVLIFYRLIPHPPNFSPIIAAALIGPYFLQSKTFTIFIVITAMFLSDIFLGFHIYQLVIYLTLISITFFASFIAEKKYLVIYAIISSLWFFITTNFAVWYYWDYYEKSFEGLLLCYTLAIPFFINTLVSTLIFTIISLVYLEPLKYIPEKINRILNLKY